MKAEGERILVLLRPLRTRLWINTFLYHAGIGVLVASICDFLLRLTAFALKNEGIESFGARFSVLFGLGIAFSSFRRFPSWSAVAANADLCFRAPDTVLSALQFSESVAMTVCQRLQVQECLGQMHLRRHELRVPVATSGFLKMSVAGLLVCISGLLMIPSVVVPGPATRSLSDTQQQMIAETIARRLPELKQSLEESSNDPSQLLNELQQQLAQLRDNKSGAAKSLAALSRMRQSLSASQQQLDKQSLANQLRRLGGALESVNGLQSASQLMQQGDFSNAAQAMLDAESPVMSREQRQSAADKLRAVADSMAEPEFRELNESVAALADALEKRDKVILRNQLEKIADSLQREAKLGSAQQMILQHQDLLLSQKSEIRRLLAADRRTQNDGATAQEVSLDDQRSPGADASANQTESAREALGNGSGLGGSGAGTATASEVLSQQPVPKSVKTERQLDRIRGLMSRDGAYEIEQVLSAGEGDSSLSSVAAVESSVQAPSTNAAIRDQMPKAFHKTIRNYFQALRRDVGESEDSK